MSCFGCWPPQAATAHSSARLPALRLAGLRAGTLRQSPAGNGRFFRGRRAQPGRRQGPCPRRSWLGGCLPGAFLTAMTRGMPLRGRRGGHRPEPIRVQRRSDSRRRRPRPRALDADLHRLQAGVEVTPLSTRERLNPLVNWLAVPEGAKTIPVIVGTVPIASARQVDRASTRRPARISSAGRSCRSLHISGWPADPTGVTSE